jgi:cell division protein ZapA (FtsZ GTPase activity inhibitor)
MSVETREEETAIEVSYGFTQVNKEIQDTYFIDKHNYSTVLDILAMYLKGQKLLYTESKTVCEQRLNFLMLPAIMITAICTILSLLLKEEQHGPTVVSCLNGFNAFLLALINYLKLDARAEAHRTSAYKFDKLQSRVEFSSGKVMFLEGEENHLPEIINSVEKDVRDIKETNQFILPEKIRYRYPRLYSINVFAEVKKIANREMLRINELKDFMNERQKLSEKTELSVQEKLRLEDLQTLIKEKIASVIRLKDDYLTIDKDFEEELNKARQNRSWNSKIFDCLKN